MREPSTSTSSAPASIATSWTSSVERPPASISMMPFCSKIHWTEPDSPSLPPCLTNVARTADAVIGRRLHQDGDAARAVPLVDDALDLGALAAAGRALDGAVDVGVRHVHGARAVDGQAQPE